MHEGGLAAVSRAESAVHHMDSTVCPHGGGWHRLRLSCWGSRRSDDDGSYRRGADDFYCGIRSSWVNKQIKKRRHVKDLNGAAEPSWPNKRNRNETWGRVS
jgi:hypothetical protein